MLEFEGINYWGVAAVWLLYVVVGSLWYSPIGFGKTWSKLSGVDIMKLPQSEANKAIVFVALSAAVQAFAFAVILNSMDVKTGIDGLTVGLVLWFGLVAASSIGTNFYARKGWKFWWLNASYFLVVMSLGGLLLGYLQQ